jgi:hypothetical protein
MTFAEKRELLQFLFSDKDRSGSPYGIYINKTGKSMDLRIDYFLYGKITGLRTLKGTDIDYDEETEYKTKTNSFN